MVLFDREIVELTRTDLKSLSYLQESASITTLHDSSKRRSMRIFIPLESIINVRMGIEVENINRPSELLGYSSHRRI